MPSTDALLNALNTFRDTLNTLCKPDGTYEVEQYTAPKATQKGTNALLAALDNAIPDNEDHVDRVTLHDALQDWENALKLDR